MDKELIFKQQHMTSLEIAEITGKQHKNVMRDIRNMEPAWEKVNGLKFELVDYRDSKGELRPCYSLTKTECLYVATKFNDEARAKLVLRWEQLEKESARRSSECRGFNSSECRGQRSELQRMSDVEILSRAVLISAKQIEALASQVEEMAPKAEYCDEVLESVSCLTTTQIAKELEMSAIELNRWLCEQGIQYGQSGQYMLYADYARRGFAQNRTHSYRDHEGELHTKTYLVWTERGREFIHLKLRK